MKYKTTLSERLKDVNPEIILVCGTILFLLTIMIGIIVGISHHQKIMNYVSAEVYTRFNIDYPDSVVLSYSTEQKDKYYLTDIYYTYQSEKITYFTEYMSIFDDKNELVIKEIIK